MVSKNAWLDDLDEYYSAKWCQDQFGKRVAVVAPGEAMIGPGAGGCGMAALFKVLDPLGKARPEATKKQHVRKKLLRCSTDVWLNGLATLRNMRRGDVTLANAGLRS